MSCVQTIQDYALRSIGYGERLLPREGYDLCQQAVLIGSGLIWNLYFAVLALSVGFFIATGLALAKASANPWLRKPANAFIADSWLEADGDTATAEDAAARPGWTGGRGSRRRCRRPAPGSARPAHGSTGRCPAWAVRTT